MHQPARPQHLIELPLGPQTTPQRLTDRGDLEVKKGRCQRSNTGKDAYNNAVKLPLDVLGEIFTFLALSCSYKSWYMVNLVCRQWRYAALQTVAVWTNPPTEDHKLTLLMLERSKMADLDVTIHKGCLEETVEAVLSHIGRVRSLTVANHAYLRDATKALRSLKGTRSRLRELRFTCTNKQVPYAEWDSDYDTRYRRQFNWEALPLPGLTHLVLDKILLYEQISVQDLLATLRDMQSLKVLHLRSDILDEAAESPTEHTSNPICLPNLQSLRIHVGAEHPQILQLLSPLQLPRLCDFALRFFDNSFSRRGTNADCSPLLRALLRMVTHGDFGTLDLLAISGADKQFQLIPQRKYRDLERNSAGEDASGGVELDLSRYEGFGSSLQRFTSDIMNILEPLILSDLAELRLRDHVDIIGTDELLPQAVIDHLANLESITICHRSLVVLTEILSVSSPQLSRTLPKLTDIVILTTHDRGYHDDTNATVDFVECLKMRYRGGAPIRKLVIDPSKFPNDSVLYTLRDVGVEVLRGPNAL